MTGVSDVIVIGGGAIGCGCAFELAKRGVSTLLLERTSPGAGASGAAAGILAAQAEARADGPAARLAVASRGRFGALAAELRERTGLDVGYRVCGITEVAMAARDLDERAAECAWQADAGLSFERLDAGGLRDAEPSVIEAAGGIRFPDDARIDPPQFVAALRIAAEQEGARVLGGAHVRRVVADRGRVTGVLLEDGTAMAARVVVLAAGSWSSLVEGTGLPPDAVRPARGQIVELAMGRPPTRGVVHGPACYLSPRDDGRVLVGLTLEFVGFRPGVTAGAVRDLLAAAIALVPALEGAAYTRAWSGFRPHSRDELPLVGHGPIEGLIVATGHFRNGILLTPITAETVSALVVGASPPAEWGPLGPENRLRPEK